jgi:hypothetical protein
MITNRPLVTLTRTHEKGIEVDGRSDRGKVRNLFGGAANLGQKL